MRCRSRTTTRRSAKRCERETELLFDSIVRDDRSVLELLTADYTFVNERLARHYGIPTSPATTSARAAPDENRRGMLGHGSILTLTSVADRTSPVLRGKWVMEVLLGSPPPPPPPERADLDETKRRRTATAAVGARAHGAAPREPGVQLVPPRDRSDRPGARELRRHRARGASRTTACRSMPTGELYDGTQIDGPAGLRAALLKHSDVVRPQLHRKADDLRARPPRRALRHAGGPRDRARRGQAATIALSAFIMGVVTSAAFQMSQAKRRATQRHAAAGTKRAAKR